MGDPLGDLGHGAQEFLGQQAHGLQSFAGDVAGGINQGLDVATLGGYKASGFEDALGDAGGQLNVGLGNVGGVINKAEGDVAGAVNATVAGAANATGQAVLDGLWWAAKKLAVPVLIAGGVVLVVGVGYVVVREGAREAGRAVAHKVVG